MGLPMRVLFVGNNDRAAVALSQDLARFRVSMLRANSRDAAYQLLGAVDAVLFGTPLDSLDWHDLTVCRAIRARSDVPIVALARRAEIGERILGSRAGADDYVCQPYSAGTLIARIETVRRLRDRQLEPSGVLRVSDVVVDLRGRSVTVAGRAVQLSRKEFLILAALAEEGGGVCTRETLLSDVWGGSGFGSDENLNVHVATLRGKLGRPGLIKTVRGTGYRLAVPMNAVSSA